MPDENKEKTKTVKDLVKVGSSMTGSAGGAIIGFLLGGPIGAIAGATLGPALAEGIKKAGDEIANRVLAPREELRVGATIIYAGQKIEEELKAGKKIRQDDFFDDKKTTRSAFAELAEGALLIAQKEYEEKKLKFQGNLLANLVFHPEIDRAQANMLIRLSERLSYRQLCVIAIFGQKGKYRVLETSYKDHLDKIDDKLGSLLQEIFQLYSEGMLSAGGHALLGVANINPSIMEPQGMGAILFNLMELYSLDEEDLNTTAKMLQ